MYKKNKLFFISGQIKKLSLLLEKINKMFRYIFLNPPPPPPPLQLSNGPPLKKDMGRGTNQTFKVFRENTGKFSLSGPMPNFGTPMPWHCFALACNRPWSEWFTALGALRVRARVVLHLMVLQVWVGWVVTDRTSPSNPRAVKLPPSGGDHDYAGPSGNTEVPIPPPPHRERLRGYSMRYVAYCGFRLRCTIGSRW